VRDVSAAVALEKSAHCRLIDGKPVAERILGEVREGVARLVSAGRGVKLVSVTFGASAASDVYVRNQRRIAAQAGIEFVDLSLPDHTTEAGALAAIAALNANPGVTGIILQRPLPVHLSVKAMQVAIDPAKDVEGMHPRSIGDIVYGRSEIGPCTALAAVELLKSSGMRLEGLEVVVIGHSEIVGKPIAFLLMAEGATVTVCHHMTRSVAMHARRADVVFVAVGKPRLVTGEMIKPGAVVIDIGINPVSGRNGERKVVGDVDHDSVREVAGWLTPVPGGVGPVTLSILMRNTLRAAQALADARPARPSAASTLDKIIIRDLELMARIGVFDHEKTEPQPIRIHAELEAVRGGDGYGVVCYAEIAEAFRKVVGSGHIALVEDAAEALSAVCFKDPRIRSVRLRLEKLRAVADAAGVGVEIFRRADSRPTLPLSS
jgi:methylenetetrahydrofolate dehydrogenase (NADP+)/methenyltetrahydrofolate cyclohydrolase